MADSDGTKVSRIAHLSRGVGEEQSSDPQQATRHAGHPRPGGYALAFRHRVGAGTVSLCRRTNKRTIGAMAGPPTLSRRRFMQLAGASAVSPALVGRTARERPNVVVVIVDTLRVDHVGAYGGRAWTPNIDALAQQGLRFTQVFPEAMPTVAARNSIVRGRRVFPFRGWHDWRGLPAGPSWFPFGDPDDTFTTALRRAGYWTAYLTDNPFLVHSGVFKDFRASFNRFARIRGQLGLGARSRVSERELQPWLIPELRTPHVIGRMSRHLAEAHRYWERESHSWAARLFTLAARTLDEAARREPFAMVVDTYEPHEPWTPPRRYIELYGDGNHRGPEPSLGRYKRVKDWLRPARVEPVLRRMRDLYAAEVTMTDRWLGVFLERLHDLRLDGRTVIVLVADHGYLFGEHGWTAKIASELHPELIQVPLIVVDPRHPGPRTSGFFASTHDIGPTLLSMAGVRKPRGMNGVDLSALFTGRKLAPRGLAFGGYDNYFYARTDRWALMADNRWRRPRLYDRAADPFELVDVAHRRPRVAQELHRRVLQRVGGPLPYYRDAS